VAFMRATQDLRFDADSGYLTATGANALNRRTTFESDVARARDEAAKGLSPAARARFMRMTDEHTLSVRQEGIRHDAAQVRDYTFKTGEAAADAYLNEAMRFEPGTEGFAKGLAAAEAEVERVSILAGLPPQAREVARRDLRSGALRAAITRVANSGVGGPTRAMAILRENQDVMSSTDVAEIETALRPVLLRDEAHALLNEAEAGPTRAVVDPTRTDVAPAGGRQEAIAAAMHGIGNVKMANQGAVRNLPITPTLKASISEAVEAVYGPGATAVVYSGGQPAKGTPGARRVGTTAHDDGLAADIRVFGPEL